MRPRRRDSQKAGNVGQVERSTRYRNLVNPFEPVRIFSDDQVENKHLAALGILERQGMRVLSRSEEHTSELQSPCNLVCRLLLEKKNTHRTHQHLPIRAAWQRDHFDERATLASIGQLPRWRSLSDGGQCK